MLHSLLLSFWNILVESAIWLIFGFVIAGVLHVLFSKEMLTKHLKGNGLFSIIRAVLIGVPLPLCSCSVIPVAKAIRDKGAGRGPVSGFLISTPETSVDSIALSYALLGPFWAIIRPFAAICTGIFSGLLQPKENTQFTPKWVATSVPSNCTTNCCCSQEPVTKKRDWKSGFRYAFHTLPVDLSRYLIPGMIIAALISYYFPPSSLQNVTSQFFQYLFALTIGVPLYVCSTSSTPLAASLLVSGISPGAVLLFLLVGPATNIVNIAALKSILGTKGMLIQVLSIMFVSLLFGLLVDVFFHRFEISLPTYTSSADEYSYLHHFFGAFLLILLLYGLFIDIRSNFFRKRQ
ncbi:MAG: SO_0444 family Cu/Zn efflux transporter [bacterium]|nr:SO_0444 family Cu/Zn efflux transporter [bacterium]